MKTKIFLTGFRGAGKTALAKLLAEKLDFELIEMDKLIVKRAGKSIAEITKQGKDWYGFRQLESEVLKDIIKKENIVVATGGGLFVNDIEFSTPLEKISLTGSKGLTFGEYNYNLVKDIPGKLIIFLKVNEKVLRERLKKGESENYNKKWRPSLTKNKNEIEENIKIYRHRLLFYKKRADVILDTSNQEPEESLRKIFKILKHENIIRY
ncbi:shikimate kinase [Patescibacteria group bacterium]|nr:shikimate kinase [Patescibacteria group bacterium]MBU4481105.1 shikimate kinase [Patescibacteria group bacterium]